MRTRTRTRMIETSEVVKTVGFSTLSKRLFCSKTQLKNREKKRETETDRQADRHRVMARWPGENCIIMVDSMLAIVHRE